MQWSIAAHGPALQGDFDRGRAPILVIDPCDTVRCQTLDAWWSAGPYQDGTPDERERVAEYRPEYGHALTGPIAVRGAAPGTTLAVRIDDVRPGAWGATVAGGRPTIFNERTGVADGEVGGTAIECPMTVELTFDVRTDLPVRSPVAGTPSGWITIGVADTIDDATYLALNAMYDLMQRRYRLERVDAVALASVVVDTRVTQIVNQVVGVHAVLAHGAVR
jgi:acetamidase/formamidase